MLADQTGMVLQYAEWVRRFGSRPDDMFAAEAGIVFNTHSKHSTTQFVYRDDWYFINLYIDDTVQIVKDPDTPVGVSSEKLASRRVPTREIVELLREVTA